MTIALMCRREATGVRRHILTFKRRLTTWAALKPKPCHVVYLLRRLESNQCPEVMSLVSYLYSTPLYYCAHKELCCSFESAHNTTINTLVQVLLVLKYLKPFVHTGVFENRFCIPFVFKKWTQ